VQRREGGPESFSRRLFFPLAAEENTVILATTSPSVQSSSQLPARRFFGVGYALLLSLTALHHSAHGAELAAKVADPGHVAPRFEVLREEDGRTYFETTIPEGSKLPRDRGMQCENAFQNLRERDLVPPPVGISEARICTYLRRAAHFDDGYGCSFGLTHLERLCQCDESTIRRISAYLRSIGMERDFGRVGRDDRTIGDARYPCTEARSTVRMFFPIPLDLVDQLTEEETLEIIAPPRVRQVPIFFLRGSEPPKPPAPAQKRPTTLDDALLVWGELSEGERPFLGPVKRIAELTGCWVSPKLLLKETIAMSLDLRYGIDAIAELGDQLRRESIVREAGGKPRYRFAQDSLSVRCLQWIDMKRRWLATSKAGKAELSATAARREKTYRDAYKSPEQNEREGFELEERARVGNAGLAAEAVARAPHGADPSQRPPMSPVATRELASLTALILHEDDPDERRALEARREALLAAAASRGPPRPS